MIGIGTGASMLTICLMRYVPCTNLERYCYWISMVFPVVKSKRILLICNWQELLDLGEKIGHVNTGLREEEILGKVRAYVFNPSALHFSSSESEKKCSICQVQPLRSLTMAFLFEFYLLIIWLCSWSTQIIIMCNLCWYEHLHFCWFLLCILL